MKKIITAALVAVALVAPVPAVAAPTSGLSLGGCIRIEREWGAVARALAGVGKTYTVNDAAKALKSAAQIWADSALLVQDRGDAKMAAQLNTGADAARKLRVLMLSGKASGIAAQSKRLIGSIGKKVVPACEREFNS